MNPFIFWVNLVKMVNATFPCLYDKASVTWQISLGIETKYQVKFLVWKSQKIVKAFTNNVIIPSCWKILCASYIGNKPLFKTFSYPIEFIRSGHRMRILVPSSFMAPKTIKLLPTYLTVLWYISDHIFILVVGGHILAFSSKFPFYIRH